MCIHQAVTQSAVMISAIYYPALTRLISCNDIKNPQFWLTSVISRPNERQKSSRFWFMVFSLVCLFHLFQYVFTCFCVGEQIKTDDSRYVSVSVEHFFIHYLLSLLQLAYDVAGTKFTVCVRVCSGYRGRRCVYRCFSGC